VAALPEAGVLGRTEISHRGPHWRSPMEMRSRWLPASVIGGARGTRRFAAGLRCVCCPRPR